MTFVLDSNVIIDTLRGRQNSVRQRFLAEVAQGTPLFVPSLVMFELYFGAAKSLDPIKERARLATFTAGAVRILDFDVDDAASGGELRATLAAAGTPIGPYDVLIGAQALRRKLTLVTADLAEFSRIPGLVVTSWR